MKEILSYKEKQEMKGSTPDLAIDNTIFRLFHSPIVEKERVYNGVAREVYIIKTQSKNEVVIKISPKATDKYEGPEVERWCLRKCAKAGVPVANVISVDEIDDGNGKKQEISVESKIPGAPFDTLHNLSTNEVNEIVSQAGSILSRIHSVPVEGFGELDKNGKGRFATVQEQLGDPYIREEKLLRVAKEIGMDPSVAVDAARIIQEGKKLCASVQPKLLHNDYEPKHWFVDKGRMSGIIDFGAARAGDPIMDLARLHYFCKDIIPMEEFLQKNNPQKGYSNKEIFKDNFDKKFNMWRIYIGLVNLVFSYNEKDTVRINLTRKEIEDDVFWYHNHLSKK